MPSSSAAPPSAMAQTVPTKAISIASSSTPTKMAAAARTQPSSERFRPFGSGGRRGSLPGCCESITCRAFLPADFRGRAIAV
jgi:hypothetical protein